MTVDKLLIELARLRDKGYGKNEVVMFENLVGDKPYHTTVEEVKVQKATFDKNREVVVLLR